MDYKEFFIRYWEKEAPATRKVIGRIPEGRSDYRADPKARTAREIAWLITQEEAALVDGLENAAFTWVEVPCPGTVAEVLAQYDQQQDALAKRLHSIPASHWDDKLPFLVDGKEVMREWGNDWAWGFLHDEIHHRGQLSTYLRPMGAKVPAIYGASADEKM
ncbi:MAG TPA: DinB family protein [Candidatus Acidoferrum sp.]|nr:DinB family protein [Candidatus Acidoferrum sp.]